MHRTTVVRHKSYACSVICTHPMLELVMVACCGKTAAFLPTCALDENTDNTKCYLCPVMFTRRGLSSSTSSRWLCCGKTAVFLPTRALDKHTDDHKILLESRDVYSSGVKGKYVIKVVLATGILSIGRGKYTTLVFRVSHEYSVTHRQKHSRRVDWCSRFSAPLLNGM